MKFSRLTFVEALLAFTVIGTAAAQTQDDFAILKKVQEAIKAAPTSRFTSTITDRDSGVVVESMVVERVAPDQVHFLSTRNGQPGTEMVSDGKRTLQRDGPNEPWKPLPVNLSAMMNQSQGAMGEEQFREQHGHLKLIGDDQVGGVAAKVYELSEDSGPSKIWLAADTSRMLKVERDYEGSGPVPENEKKRERRGRPEGAASAAQGRDRATPSALGDVFRLRPVDQDHDAKLARRAESCGVVRRKFQPRQFSATQLR